VTEAQDENWKLDLRYGRIKTGFVHFTAIADGTAGELRHGFACRPGSAVMSMKLWAADANEAFAMVRDIGGSIGFDAHGKIELFDTPPEQPPRENPHGYDINFVEYDD
jgi:hypothetical protein